MKVSHTRRIPAPREKVLEAYASTEFYEQKQKQASGALSVEILETEELADGKLRMRARVSERSRLPSFLRQSDVDTYIDETLLDPARGTLTWKITPQGAGAKRFFLSGVVEFHDEGDETRVVYNVEMRVKVPLVGAKAEKLALAKTEEETDQQAAFLRQWVADH